MTDSRVYVAGSSRDGPLKIGITGSPVRRLGQLQTGNAVRLHIYWTSQEIPADHARRVEYNIHRLLAAKRLNGEWFEIPMEVAVETVMRALAPPRPLEIVRSVDPPPADECGDVVWLWSRSADEVVYDPPLHAAEDRTWNEPYDPRYWPGPS